MLKKFEEVQLELAKMHANNRYKKRQRIENLKTIQMEVQANSSGVQVSCDCGMHLLRQELSEHFKDYVSSIFIFPCLFFVCFLISNSKEVHAVPKVTWHTFLVAIDHLCDP